MKKEIHYANPEKTTYLQIMPDSDCYNVHENNEFVIAGSPILGDEFKTKEDLINWFYSVWGNQKQLEGYGGTKKGTTTAESVEGSDQDRQEKEADR